MQKNTQEVESRPGRRLDIIFLVALSVGLLLFIALFTYSPTDPSLTVSSTQATHNAAGKVGAFMADFFFSAFGYLSYILPVLLIGKLALLIKTTPSLQKNIVFIRVLGFILTITMCCVFAELSVIDASHLPAGAGGILGSALTGLLLPLFGFAGTVLVMVGLLALGLMLYFEFSWLTVFERVGEWALSLYGKKDRWLKQIGEIKVKSPSLEGTSKLPALVNNASSNNEIELDFNFTSKDDLPWQDIHFEQENDTEIVLPISQVAAKAPTKFANTKPAKVAEAAVDIPIQPLEKRESAPSERAQRELQGGLFNDMEPLPSIALLTPPRPQVGGFSAERLQELSRLLVQKLADFGVKVEVTAVAPGPVITRFEIQPAPGVKASKISNLARDLARSMAMPSVRVVEVIPGKSVMGIEIPNEDRAIVSLSEVLSSQDYDKSKSPLTLALGHDIGGNPVITDLAKMPHLLVAGTTGSGKSVGVNAMLLSLLFKATPDELRLILVDPKMLELSVYEGIPHLLTPVVTDMKEAASALRWSVAEMERRYQLMAAMGVRNLAGFNKKINDAIEEGKPLTDPLWKIEQSFETQPPLLEPLPYIVIVIDEFADMMMMVGKKVEELIARIAQKARAAGIHMILATQRPSVDVITGLIKANIPTRMAFQVSSKIDSRTILDQGGAEQLLGHGDMLFMPPGIALPERVHGAFVDDDEVHRVVAEWKKRGAPQYLEEITSIDEDGNLVGSGDSEGSADGEQDELYDLAVAFVLESGKCSISSVQRKLRVGYNRAANIVDAMQAAGVVSAPAHNGSREVLVGSGSDY
ncbi:MAG: DNA translocase FtsK 4TM domain-containing protein [Venatoribacter sp.]